MFDFIRKPDLWASWDAGHGRELGGGPFHLKTAQDLSVYGFLRELRNKKIAEIGGGDSRILKRIAPVNQCYNIEKFEGADGGPEQEIRIDGVKNIKVFVGEFSNQLADDSFDVAFSVSVVEHVPSSMLEDYFRDCIRIIKPGGLFLHAIDFYLSDRPSAGQIERFEAYRQWTTSKDLDWVGGIYRGPLQFSCTMATNPDLTMYNWGKASPTLINTRLRSQSVSLLTAARKR